jgi:hypothetical protein
MTSLLNMLRKILWVSQSDFQNGNDAYEDQILVAAVVDLVIGVWRDEGHMAGAHFSRFTVVKNAAFAGMEEDFMLMCVGMARCVSTGLDGEYAHNEIGRCVLWTHRNAHRDFFHGAIVEYLRRQILVWQNMHLKAPNYVWFYSNRLPVNSLSEEISCAFRYSSISLTIFKVVAGFR